MLEIIAELPPALSRRSPIAKRNWKPMKARKFGYDVAHARLLTRVHRRTGRGTRGAAPPPPQSLANSDVFGQQEKFGQSQFLNTFPCFLLLLLLLLLLLF